MNNKTFLGGSMKIQFGTFFVLFLVLLSVRIFPGDITNTKSGNWSDATIWSSGTVPGASDNVHVIGGTTVTYDMDSSTVANLYVGSDTSTTGGWRTSNTKATILNVTGNIKIFSNMSFYAQSSTTLFSIHKIYLQGNIENNGSKFDMRNGSAAPSCLNVINFVFYGTANSTVKMGTYSTTNNEFNGVTINKTNGARVVLLSDMVCAQGSSSYATQNALVHFNEGIIQTNANVFYHLSTTSADMDTGKANSYVIGSLGRAMGASSGKTNAFAVGDEAGYRPIYLKSSTAGVATGQATVVSCISGKANTGSSVFPDGLIDKVSEVRYYKAVYTYLINTPPDTMGFDSFRPSYEAGDGIAAGNSDIRVAYSTDDRASWYTLHDNYPDVTVLQDLPKYYMSDTMATSIILRKGVNSVYIALARLTGTTTNSLTSTVDVRLDVPKSKSFLVEQNYPNPFNPSTTIRYSIPENSFITLKVYNTLGKEVAVLANEYKSAGYYQASFNGSELSSGIYFYTLHTGSFTETRKMILMK
jgi:hypothetical protein